MAHSSPVSQYARSRDGTRIFYQWWPVETPKAAVLVVHGYAEHSGRYDHLAHYLNQFGVDVFALDLRGHGLSEGRRGLIRYFDNYRDDLRALLDAADRASSAEAYFFLGHGLGALIVLHDWIGRSPTRSGIIPISPYLGLPYRVPRRKEILRRAMSLVWPSFRQPNGVRPAQLSRDPKVGETYEADPRVFRNATARWFTETEKAILRVKDDAARITVPCLMLLGEEDRIIDPEQARSVFDALGSEDKRLIVYSGFYHDILNEYGKDRVLKKIADWIAEKSNEEPGSS